MRSRKVKSQIIMASVLLLMVMMTPVQARQLMSVEYMDSAYSAYPYVRFVEDGDKLSMSDDANNILPIFFTIMNLHSTAFTLRYKRMNNVSRRLLYTKTALVYN